LEKPHKEKEGTGSLTYFRIFHCCLCSLKLFSFLDGQMAKLETTGLIFFFINKEIMFDHGKFRYSHNLTERCTF